MLSRLMEDLKTSMKEKDTARKEVIQLIIGKAKGIAKDTLVEVEDSHIMMAVNSELKQTKEALEMMKDNLSEESLKEYEYKIKSIMEYLPKQLSEHEVLEHIEHAIYELNLPREQKSMGNLMKYLKSKLGNSVEGKVLSDAIKKSLK